MQSEQCSVKNCLVLLGLCCNSIWDNVFFAFFTVSVLGQDEGCTVQYSPLPEGTPEGKGLYLTVQVQVQVYFVSIQSLVCIIQYAIGGGLCIIFCVPCTLEHAVQSVE